MTYIRKRYDPQAHPKPVLSKELREWALNRYTKCMICKRPFDDMRKPVIDHCHRTGELRGVLCRQCNSGLGMFTDNMRIVWRAFLYLYNRDKREAFKRHSRERVSNWINDITQSKDRE